MTVVLNNTILSNFSVVRQPNLVSVAFVEPVVSTSAVFSEMKAGVDKGKLPTCDWTWLPKITLKPTEQNHLTQLQKQFGLGEATCLALCLERGFKLATDDRDARRWAAQANIPYTGTIGLLVILVINEHISLADGNDLLKQMIEAGYRSPVLKLDSLLN